jgi:DNA-binding NtrC family response regulator
MSNNRSILLIDDEEALLSVTKLCLEAIGYTVHDFSCPLQAKDYFIKHHDSLDAILSDYHMPEIKGDELLNFFISINNDKLYILSSGDQINTAKQANIVSIEKPYDFSDLSDILEKRDQSKPKVLIATSSSD